VIIVRLVDDTIEVRRNLHVSAPQRANPISAEPSNEITEFQNHVLARARLWGFSLLIALVIRRKQNDSKANVAVGFDFLDDGASLACLLMKNDRSKAKSLNEARNLRFCFSIVPVHDKDLV